MNLLRLLQKPWEKKLHPVKLVSYINSFANHSKRQRHYKRKFWNLARKLAEYEKYRTIVLLTDSIHYSVFEDFIYFLKEQYPYRLATLSAFKNQLATILKHAERNNFKCNFSFLDYNIRKEDSVAVYLNIDEIKRIFRLELPQQSAVVRDRFIVGCCTGMRYQAYSTLNTDSFEDGLIKHLTGKTKANIILPVHWMINQIISRNGGRLPEIKHSHQNFNKIIKTVCKRAKINNSVLVERTEGNNIIRKKIKKYMLISSHTARRSFATNMYLADIPAAKIMLFTGHKTEAAFFRYIKIDKVENAKELASHPFFIEKK